MTKLLTIAQKQTLAAALAAQLAEYQANGGRVLTVTKDTVIEPQPKSDWITPTTAKPLQVIESPRRNQSPKIEPKPPAQPKPPAKKQKPMINAQRKECPNTIIGNQRRAEILEYMRKAGEPVTRQMIAESVGMTVHGGLKHQIKLLMQKNLIKFSYASGKGGKQFYEVTT